MNINNDFVENHTFDELQIGQSARLLRTLTDTTYLLGRSTLASPVRAAAALREHSAIVDAIRRRDPEGAASAARHHIHQALMERLKMLRQG